MVPTLISLFILSYWGTISTWRIQLTTEGASQDLKSLWNLQYIKDIVFALYITVWLTVTVPVFIYYSGEGWIGI